MNIQRFYDLIESSTTPTKTEMTALRQMVEEYPYFQSAIFLYIKSLFIHCNEEYKEELARLSIFVSDRKALFYYVFSDEYKAFFEQTGKTDLAEDKTMTLLSAFFSNSKEPDTSALEYEMLNSSLASTDYLTYMGAGIASPNKVDVPLKHQEIIDSFIKKSEEDNIHVHLIKEEMSNNEEDYETKEDDASDELQEDLFFTETLAKIYLRQKKYDKAHKIIQHLSLNFPKKNAYFADQLKFIEKLIVNSKYKKEVK